MGRPAYRVCGGGANPPRGETSPAVMAELGHTDPSLALSIYAHAMRRDDGDNERLRSLVEGADIAGLVTGDHSEGTVTTATSVHSSTESRSTSGVYGDAPGRIRTCDFCLRRAALYPLSYGRGENPV
jgi:hypothetical protein